MKVKVNQETKVDELYEKTPKQFSDLSQTLQPQKVQNGPSTWATLKTQGRAML